MIKKSSACTTVLVGKKASIDGSTMIARNDDTFSPITPQKFIIKPAIENNTKNHVKSWLNNFEIDLPANAQRVSAVPNVDYKHLSYYDESGINQDNVAMSCTESTYGNERTLAFDPLVKDGLDEDCMQTVVLPYIHSAKDGVKYLAKLIANYGSPAGNSVLFSDQNEIWYMEIVTGHHWVAQRIPDDCYAVAANRVSITQVNFNDQINFMWSKGIQEFVSSNQLNPDNEGWNFRHIFGTYTEQDRHYNTSRVWYAQKYFNPEIRQDPQDGDLPFIYKANRKITREDIEFILGSHYQDTVYDPFGKGTDAEKHCYRPIGLNRTQNSHILQIKNNIDADKSAIIWLCIGGPTFTPYVPFFANMNDTDLSYNDTSLTYNIKDAYWYYKSFATLVESHYPQFVQLDINYLTELNRYYRARIASIVEKAKGLSGDKLTNYLTRENQKTVEHTKKETEKLWGKMMIDSINMSKLTFNMDKNL